MTDEELLEKDDLAIQPDDIVDEDVKKTLQTQIARAKHWKAKVEKLTQAQAEALKAKQEAEEKLKLFEDKGGKEHQEVASRLGALEELEEKRLFGHERDLSPAEVDVVFKYAKGTKKAPGEVLDDPFVKGGLEALRGTERAKQAIPSSGAGNPPTVNGKTFAQMTPEERRANYGKLMQG